MRPWTIVILGALVLSLALPSGADARVRFGPGAVLGAVAGSFGAIFGGYRHSSRHHRRSASRPSVGRRNADVARLERPAAVGVPPPAESAAHEPMVSPDRPPALFWPDAAADLVEYLFFPNGNDRFWAHGYDTVLGYAVAGSAADDRRGLRRQRVRPQALCRRCRRPYASAAMVRDLTVVERELGFSYEMRPGQGVEHYQQVCPRCRRSLYGLAQAAMWRSAGVESTDERDT